MNIDAEKVDLMLKIAGIGCSGITEAVTGRIIDGISSQSIAEKQCYFLIAQSIVHKLRAKLELKNAISDN